MGLSQIGQPLVRRKGLDVQTHRVGEGFAVTHHPRLGLARLCP